MDYSAIYPEIILALFAIAIPAVGMVIKDSKYLAAVSLAGVALSMLAVLMHFYDGGGAAVFDNGLLVLDAFSGLFMMVFLSVAFVVILASGKFIEVRSTLRNITA